MSSTILSFGLDIIILIALGITIFYAVRLSQNLNKFRLHREEFNEFMAELSKNIETADNAVQNLKQASLATGDQLRRKVRDGQHLYDELKIMVESAENIANRLEDSVPSFSEDGRKREKKSLKNEETEEENDWFIEDIPEAPNNNKKPQGNRKIKEEQLPSFFIQDREFDKGEEPQKTPEKELQSQAEKELYEALQQNKKTAASKS